MNRYQFGTALAERFAQVVFGGALLMSALGSMSSEARQVDAVPSNYQERLKTLQPGDVLKLAPGIYTNGLTLHAINGTAQRPIVISGASGDAKTHFVERPGANTVSIADASYLIVENLVITGTGASSDAVKAEGHAQWAHHITLQNLEIRGYGANQQTVGISTKCPTWDWVIRGNTIVGAGTGMYLGNSDGTAPFIGGRIEYNVIRDTVGYNIEVKQQQVRVQVAGAPENARDTIIRHNVFAKQRGGARANFARPNLLVGHFPPVGPGSLDRYLIYGNLFYQNPTERLFQGEGTVAFYNNVLINDYGDGAVFQPHKGIPKRIWAFQNTVLVAGMGIEMVSVPATEVARIEDNVVFAALPIRGGVESENLTGFPDKAPGILFKPTGALGKLNLGLKTPDRPGTSVNASKADFLDAGCDYAGRPRHTQLVGAFAQGPKITLSLRRMQRRECAASITPASTLHLIRDYAG